MPYLKTKATDLYERLGGGVDADLFSSPSAPISSPLALLRNASLNPSLFTRLKLSSQALFKLSYPYVNLLWELYLLVYNLRYLFGKSPYWRPWFRLLGIEVRRMGQEDYVSSVVIAVACSRAALTLLSLAGTPQLDPDAVAETLRGSSRRTAYDSPVHPPHPLSPDPPLPLSRARLAPPPPPSLDLRFPPSRMVVLADRRRRTTRSRQQERFSTRPSRSASSSLVRVRRL